MRDHLYSTPPYLPTPPNPAWLHSASLSGFGLFDDDKVDANPFNDDNGDDDENDDEPSPTPAPDDDDDDDNGLDLFDDDEEKSVDNGAWV